MAMKSGVFITIEGCEGAGKTYQTKTLAASLQDRGYDVVLTREPGGTALGEAVRAILLNPQFKGMDGVTEYLLYSAARVEHLKSVIVPAVKSGKIVICDRYIHSSIAYQGYGRGIGREFCDKINSQVALLPIDKTYFLDISPEQAFKRKGGADQSDRVEQESMEFFNKVYNGYCTMADNGELERVPCNGTKFETAQTLLDTVLNFLKTRGYN